MVITPKVRRLIAEGVALLPDPMRDRWNEWARPFEITESASEVPYEIADLALQALTAAEQDIEWRLQRPNLHEDARSDMLNDLGDIRAIQATIRAENVGQ